METVYFVVLDGGGGEEDLTLKDGNLLNSCNYSILETCVLRNNYAKLEGGESACCKAVQK